MRASIGQRTYLAFAVLWMVLLLMPLVAPNHYFVNLGISWLIDLILIASLNLLMGYGGQLSLSHAAFFGLGAYTSGVLSAKFGLSPWLGLFAAIALTGVVAVLIGSPTLRLKGHYLAMATLGFNAIASVLFVEWRDWTGGPNGLINVPSVSLFGVSLSGDVRFFYFAWAMAGVVLLVILNLLDSRMGRALRALSSSELAAAAMGVDVHRYKVQVFVLTAVMAAIAGYLYVHHNNFASPESFDFMTSVMMVVVVALGGTGSFWGPFLGALVYVVLPELLQSAADFQVLFFGVSLLVVLLFFPRGLSGLLDVERRSRDRPAEGRTAEGGAHTLAPSSEPPR